MLLRKITGRSKRARFSRFCMIALTLMGIAAHKLLGTVLGVFLLSLGAAWYLAHFTDVAVLGPSELLAELSKQPGEVLLGVVGIIVAYFGLSAWKQQKCTELSLQAAGDIQAFFKRAFDLALQLEDFCDDCSKLHKQIQAGKSLAAVQFDVDWVGGRMEAVAANRHALSALGVEAHSIEARYGAILHSKLFAISRLASGVDALNELTAAMWSISIPTFAKDSPSLYLAIQHSSGEEWSAFRKTFQRHAFQMLAYSGAVSGELSGKLFVPSLLGTWHIVRRIHQLAEVPDGSS